MPQVTATRQNGNETADASIGTRQHIPTFKYFPVLKHAITLQYPNKTYFPFVIFTLRDKHI